MGVYGNRYIVRCVFSFLMPWYTLLYQGESDGRIEIHIQDCVKEGTRY